MPRRPRGLPAASPYHVVNRAVRRAPIFQTPADYLAFQSVLCEALHEVPLNLFAYCAMPNHWHLVLQPDASAQLPAFMHWLTGTHARRWHTFNGTNGTGPLYQGRYKAVIIESERQFLWACRYVERNPLRAGLVASAREWRWSSLRQRSAGGGGPRLSDWPCPRPHDWAEYVDRVETEDELEAVDKFRGKGRRPGRPRNG